MRVIRVQVAIAGGLAADLRRFKHLAGELRFRKQLAFLPAPVADAIVDARGLLAPAPDERPYVVCERAVLPEAGHAALVRVLEQLAALGSSTPRSSIDVANLGEGSLQEAYIVAKSSSPLGTADPDPWSEALSVDGSRADAINRLVDAALLDLSFRSVTPSKEEREWLRTRVLGAVEPAGLEPARALLADALGIDRR